MLFSFFCCLANLTIGIDIEETTTIAAIMVGFLKALKSYDEQKNNVDYMIIVDNASTDATADWLDKWKNENHKFFVEIIHSKENLGGSGGFYLG